MSQDTPNLSPVLGEKDYHRLWALLEGSHAGDKLLEETLNKADVVSDEMVLEGVVALYSTVRFNDLNILTEEIVTLVLPHESDITNKKISVLTPVGISLIGRRVGHVINWRMPNKKIRCLKIISVEY